MALQLVRFLAISLVTSIIKDIKTDLVEEEPEPPIYIWPLGKDRDTIELNYETYGLRGEDVFLHEGEGPFRYKPFFFSGRENSYITLRVSESPDLASDVSFRFYIYPLKDSGTLFHYKAIMDTVDVTNGLSVRLSSGRLNFILRGGIYTTLLQSLEIIPLYEWTLVTVAIDIDNAVDVILNDSTDVESINIPFQTGPLNAPGFITIGTDQYSDTNEFDKLVGSFTCLQMIAGINSYLSPSYDDYCTLGGGSSTSTTPSTTYSDNSPTTSSFSATTDPTSSTTTTPFTTSSTSTMTQTSSTSTTMPISTTSTTPKTSSSAPISTTSATTQVSTTSTTSTSSASSTTSTSTTFSTAPSSTTSTTKPTSTTSTISTTMPTSTTSTTSTTTQTSTTSTTSTTTPTSTTSTSSTASTTTPITTTTTTPTTSTSIVSTTSTSTTSSTTSDTTPTSGTFSLTPTSTTVTTTTPSTTSTETTSTSTASTSTPSSSISQTSSTLLPFKTTSTTSTTVPPPPTTTTTSTTSTSSASATSSDRPHTHNDGSSRTPFTSITTSIHSTLTTTDATSSASPPLPEAQKGHSLATTASAGDHPASTTTAHGLSIQHNRHVISGLILQKAIYVDAPNSDSSAQTCRRFRKLGDDVTFEKPDEILRMTFTDDLRSCIRECNQHGGCGTFSVLERSDGKFVCEIGKPKASVLHSLGYKFYLLG